MSKIIYITEQQEQELVDRYLKESLIVNSAQVMDIKNYLNKRFKKNFNEDDIGKDGLPVKTMFITYYDEQGNPKMNLKKTELLDVLNDKYKHFVKDDASRLAYFSQIIEDWLSGNIMNTGQLSVNAIADAMIEKYKNHKKEKKTEETKKEDKNEKKDEK